METMRFEFPKNNFLKKIQKIIKEKNLIFIIDECTTGLEKILVDYIQNIN